MLRIRHENFNPEEIKMKLVEAMKAIDEGWVRRLKGYRVHFQKWEDNQWVSDFFPGEKAKPMTSEVSAWELARRFSAAGEPSDGEARAGEVINVYVVDDHGNRVKFYGPDPDLVFNPGNV